VRKVIWGVLGCAGHAYKRAIPAMLRSPSVELIGAASRSEEKAESFRTHFGLEKSYSSYESLLEDPRIEAVYVALPNAMHAEWILKAFEAGKHVLCEKPLTVNGEEAQQVLAAANRTQRRIMEAFMWRFHVQHHKARALVRSGAIGPLRLVRAAFSYQRTRNPNIRLAAALGGGSILDIGCYEINAARFYFEDEPVSVYAEASIDEEFGVDMSMSGILHFAKGKALIDCALDLPSRKELELVGENGTILFRMPWAPENQATIYVNGIPEILEEFDQFVAQFEYFSRCLLQGIEPDYGPEDSLRQMRVIDAVFSSIQSGRRICL
jgi:D-xylose 1-dehydrogenase (NADP+, D-xylono-1,5-lactone-forming)